MHIDIYLLSKNIRILLGELYIQYCQVHFGLFGFFSFVCFLFGLLGSCFTVPIWAVMYLNFLVERASGMISDCLFIELLREMKSSCLLNCRSFLNTYRDEKSIVSGGSIDAASLAPGVDN